MLFKIKKSRNQEEEKNRNQETTNQEVKKFENKRKEKQTNKIIELVFLEWVCVSFGQVYTCMENKYKNQSIFLLLINIDNLIFLPSALH